MTGSETIQEACKIRNQITALLKLGCFPLRQWASNNSEILKGLSKEQIDSHFQLDDDHTLKTLGISWTAKTDSIVYTVNAPNVK